MSNIKRINAVLGLSIIAAFLTHVGYEVYSYITFYYNPVVTKVIAYTALGLVALHVICSIISVAGHDKGNGLKYPGMNVRTVLQRASAGFMLVFIILHMNTFDMLPSNEGNRPVFILILLMQVLFFASVFTHVAVSLTNAFITLGWLTSGRTRKKLDIVIWGLCAVLFAASAIVITRTQYAMFTGGGA